MEHEGATDSIKEKTYLKLSTHNQLEYIYGRRPILPRMISPDTAPEQFKSDTSQAVVVVYELMDIQYLHAGSPVN